MYSVNFDPICKYKLSSASKWVHYEKSWILQKMFRWNRFKTGFVAAKKWKLHALSNTSISSGRFSAHSSRSTSSSSVRRKNDRLSAKNGNTSAYLTGSLENMVKCQWHIILHMSWVTMVTRVDHVFTTEEASCQDSQVTIISKLEPKGNINYFSSNLVSRALGTWVMAYCIIYICQAQLRLYRDATKIPEKFWN